MGTRAATISAVTSPPVQEKNSFIIMPKTLYFLDLSPPARSVHMVCRELNIDIDIKRMDLFNGEQKQDWFLKLNPDHCVPTLDDDGFCIWESRSIMRYLVNAYAPGHTLYPTEAKARAMVDKALDRDLGFVYKHVAGYVYPQVFK